jgi:hypothetical protein
MTHNVPSRPIKPVLLLSMLLPYFVIAWQPSYENCRVELQDGYGAQATASL